MRACAPRGSAPACAGRGGALRDRRLNRPQLPWPRDCAWSFRPPHATSAHAHTQACVGAGGPTQRRLSQGGQQRHSFSTVTPSPVNQAQPPHPPRRPPYSSWRRPAPRPHKHPACLPARLPAPRSYKQRVLGRCPGGAGEGGARERAATAPQAARGDSARVPRAGAGRAGPTARRCSRVVQARAPDGRMRARRSSGSPDGGGVGEGGHAATKLCARELACARARPPALLARPDALQPLDRARHGLHVARRDGAEARGVL